MTPAAAHQSTPDVTDVELSTKDGRKLLDERAQAVLGISGSEFLRRYKAGTVWQLKGNVAEVAILVPFAT